MKKKPLFLFLWILLAGRYPTLAIEPSVSLVQQSVDYNSSSAGKLLVDPVLKSSRTTSTLRFGAPCLLQIREPELGYERSLVAKNGFFDKKADSLLRIGIRSWAKGSKKVIQRHWRIGTELAIGPVIEWHPFNGIAIQSGVLYSYNSFFTVQFSVDHKNLLDRSASSFGSRVVDAINELSARSEGYIAHAGLDHIYFHAITFPFFCRIYPKKSRRFVIYGGPRLLFVLASLERKEYCPVHIDTRIIKDIFYDALKQGRAVASEDGAAIGDLQPIVEEGLLKVYRSVFRLNPNLNQSAFSNNRCFYWDLVWEFGVEFRIKHGFVIGINGLGVVLGYDFFN